MPQLKLAEQQVVQPSLKEYHIFVNSRPWKGELKKVGRSVWPRWPLEETGGTIADANEEAPGLEFLADVATCFLGKIDRSARETATGGDAGDGSAGNSFLLQTGMQLAKQWEDKDDSAEENQETDANKDKQVETRPTNTPGNKWKSCQDCGETLRDWSQASQRSPSKRFTCADVGRLCISLKSTCRSCMQATCVCKKRQKPFSIFSDSASSRLPDGFLVEIKFRPGTIEGLGLGPPWMSIWGCCQECRLIRTMDRRERVEEFLLEHQSHNLHWKEMQIDSFDFRIEERIRELYKIFCEASRNRLLTYTVDDKYIPTRVINPEPHPGLQQKINHLESLLKSGTETRKELETTAGIYCKRKRMSQSMLEKRTKRKPGQTPSETTPIAPENQMGESTLIDNKRALETSCQWPKEDDCRSVGPVLLQGIHLPFPSFGEEASQPSSANQTCSENLKSAEEYNGNYGASDQQLTENGITSGIQGGITYDCSDQLNGQGPTFSLPNQVIASGGSDCGLNLFDWQSPVGDKCMKLVPEDQMQGAVCKPEK